MSNHNPPSSFEVELPAGGKLQLQTLEEMDLFEKNAARYQSDYHLSQLNDLMLVGAILTQQVAMLRAQKTLAGMVPQTDANGVPTGRYVVEKTKPEAVRAARKDITEAGIAIMELEKALGVDKKTREAGGSLTVAGYVEQLKIAARSYGIHIANRVKAMEAVAMEARWKLRLLQNGDAEDRAYHNLTPEKFCDWLRDELAKLEEVDKKYAKEKGRLFVGKV